MSGTPVEARVPFGDLAAKLEQRARMLAEAHAQTRALARSGDASRWHRAALLWPLFTKG